MPVVRSLAAGQRRVRTGCLTCRKRKRKCDEKKPRCDACRSKDLECEWPPAFVFVSPHPSDVAEVPKAPNASHSASPSLGASSPQWMSVSSSASGVKPPVPQNTAAQDNVDLLRHFRYALGPWLDVGDPNCSYGNKMLQLIQANRPLETAVLALSAYQRSLVSTSRQSGDYETSLRLREEFESTFDRQDACARSVGNTLLLIGDIFSSGPSHWRDMLSHYIDVFGYPQSSVAMGTEMGDALFWLHCRLDLAVSIRNSRPPQMFLPSYRASINQPPYQHSLQNLSSVLLAIFGSSLGNPDFSSQWTSAWSNCQTWYRHRPDDLQPIIDVRGTQALQLELKSDSSFPVLIFTTALAVVSNAMYHIASMLLLTHKPRLSNPLSGSRYLLSHSWHAQSLAGIATNNDSFEQWDPILIAGFLLIAKDMTYEPQQIALAERLEHIALTTGINLGNEVQDLRNAWNMSRYHDEAYD